ncbi:acetylglutamate kinase [Haliovirga abyssi]|uniref:Acetylglutamate kinase n=1 Tax=Haliovirga abyssi TaxID=2996794 RepID=A0AAU9DG03_9FUSO|nr:acetylglutamate kinase [Haliovirga abyssi]BDU51158.1 acetylglutamate kinase [Haliovirga abyssi]
MIGKKIERAEILMEALPYIKEFYGKTVVIKYGGNAMIDEKIKDEVVQDIVLMKFVGMNPVIIHGGGPEINKVLSKLGKTAQFNMGNRVTDYETMEVVEMVLAGKINKNIVTKLNKFGGKAVGLSGTDANLIVADKKYIEKEGEKVDIGYVGNVKTINPRMIRILEKEGFIPVISPVGVDEEGKSYNINADYVAGELAGALGAYKFILMTDIAGILKDIEDKSSIISEMSLDDAEKLIDSGIISGGMLPKVDACLTALKKGAERVHIIDGRVRHAILLELFTDDGIGTMIKKADKED